MATILPFQQSRTVTPKISFLFDSGVKTVMWGRQRGCQGAKSGAGGRGFKEAAEPSANPEDAGKVPVSLVNEAATARRCTFRVFPYKLENKPAL